MNVREAAYSPRSRPVLTVVIASWLALVACGSESTEQNSTDAEAPLVETTTTGEQDGRADDARPDAEAPLVETTTTATEPVTDEEASESDREASSTAAAEAENAKTRQECFGDVFIDFGDAGESGDWWYAGDGIGASVFLWAHEYETTAYDQPLPDGCDFAPYLNLWCVVDPQSVDPQSEAPFPYTAGVWWGSVLAQGDSEWLVNVDYSLDGGETTRNQWWLFGYGGYSSTDGESANAFTRGLSRSETLLFKGRDHMDRLSVQAEFLLHGIEDALAHLRRSCNWFSDDPPLSVYRAEAGGQWVILEGENEQGAYIAAHVEGVGHGAHDFLAPPRLFVRCAAHDPTTSAEFFVPTPFSVYNGDTQDGVAVRWRIAPEMASAVTESNWWSDQDPWTSALFQSDGAHLASRLATTETGTLVFDIIQETGDGDVYELEFDVTGAAAALSNFACL